MKRYDKDDMATFYFVVYKDDSSNIIRAWSDDKKIVSFYMNFHNSDKFKLKSITNTIKEISNILNENITDEVLIYNVMIRDPKNKNKVALISIPATESEIRLISSDSSDFLGSRINYSYMNGVLPYMHDKYQKALSKLFMSDIIDFVVNNRKSKIIDQLSLDQVLLLFRSLPDTFGK